MGVARIFFGGGGGTRFQKNFQKIFKKIQNIFKKSKNIFNKFLKNFQKKFQKVAKVFKNFLKKIVKMHYFSRLFTKFKKLCVDFLRVWTKNTNYWKFWENFRNFSKVFFGKLLKCINVADISKHLTNHVLIFWAFGRKNNLQNIFEKISKNFLKKIVKNALF